MPIRINLLAEAQAAEDARRRDPVKRGIWLGCFLIFCVVLWSGYLWVDIFQANSALKRQEGKWATSAPRYKEVTANDRKVKLVQGKLDSLDRLSTNRFLWGPVLNALQTVQVNDLDQIQIKRLRGEQIFVPVDAIPAKTNVTALSTNVIPRVAAGAIEKASLRIEAQDWNPGPAETWNKYKAALCNSEFFSKRLQRKDGFVLSGTVSEPKADFNVGKFFVSFALEYRFPEIKRSE